MKRLTLLSLLLVFSLVLAACANTGNGNGTPVPGMETEVFEGTDVAELPEETVGVPVTGTEVVPGEATEVTPEQATATVDEGLATQAAGDGTDDLDTPGLNDMNVNLLSELTAMAVVNQQCEVIGEVDSVLVNRNGGIVYVEVETDMAVELPDQILIPFAALDINRDLNNFDAINTPGGMNGVQVTQSPGTTGSTTEGTQGTPVVGDAQATQPVEGENGNLAVCDFYDRGEAVMLNVDAASLNNIPDLGTDDDLRGTISAQDWDNEIRSFWTNLGVTVAEVGEAFGIGDGADAAATQAPDATLAPDATQAVDGMNQGQLGAVVEIEDLGDLDVSGVDGDDIGEIEDFILDADSGRLTHALVSVGGFLGIGERYVPVPFNAINWSADDDGSYVLSVNADRERLENAPAYDSLDEFPNVDEPGWDSEFESFWNTNVE